MTNALSGQFKKRVFLIGAVLVVMALLWVGRKYQDFRVNRAQQREAEQAANEAAQVKTYRVRPRKMSGALKRIGTIRARAETNLQFGAPGRINKFDVEKGQFVRKGTVVAALDQSEARNALSVAALEFDKANIKYFRDGTIDRLSFEQAKARYQQAKLEVDKTVIRAGHDGYLVEKWLNAGEHVDPSSVIGKLMDKSRVTIELDLSEDDIRYLKQGQTVAVTVDAVPDYKEEGVVLSITPYLKGDSRSFSVKVDVPKNPDEKLSPGMFARCTIRRYEKENAITIPLEAGAEVTEKTVRVFVVASDNTVSPRTLDVLFSDEGQYEVSGLQDGDQVVLTPGADLKEGSAVTVMSVFDPLAHEPVPTPGPDQK